mgnify:FL=1
MPDKHQFFNGEMFTRDERTGYYLCSRNNENGIRKRMHVYVWEYYNGSVPSGYEIHHIDENKANNCINNLDCIKVEKHREYHANNMTEERKEHIRLMQTQGILRAPEWHRSTAGREWHKVHYEKMKSLLHKKEEFTCKNCGKTFIAVDTGNVKFCSNSCKSAYRKRSGVDNVVRKCEYCGKEFVINKYAKRRFCSTECSFKAVPRGGCGNRHKKH